MLLCCAGARAAELPDPLTLEAALATAGNEKHYELLELEQQMQVIAAELGIERGQSGFNVDLRGRLSKVGPSDYDPDTPDDDSQAHLVLTKPLYDFGLRDSRENYLGLQLLELENRKRLLLERRRVDIMQRYFDVLDADNDYRSENEALAVGFNRYDRARENQELGRVSAIEVLRLQTEYETIRRKRSLAMHRQRLTRATLAEAMGYPEHLPSELERPRIETGRILPENIDALVERALTYSPEARLADASSRAAQAAIGIASNSDGPSLALELEVSEYARDSRLRDDWRANLLIDIPIYSATASNKVELERARHRIALANQQQLQSKLRLDVLELWQKIQQLALEIDSAAV
jgi:outer membrane protein TolC